MVLVVFRWIGFRRACGIPSRWSRSGRATEARSAFSTVASGRSAAAERVSGRLHSATAPDSTSQERGGAIQRQPVAIALAASTALVLSSAGPVDAGCDEWTSSGPPGGTVLSLAIDSSTLWAGTWGGVYKRENGRVSWDLANAGLDDLDALSLVIDPSTPSTVYAGTNGDGVYKSEDGGSSWHAANSGLPFESHVEALAIDPLTSAALYAAVVQNVLTPPNPLGVYKSVNGGSSWVEANTGLSNLGVRAIAIDPTTPSTLYAGTFGGVFKSVDGGGSWSPVSTGLPADPDVRSLAIDPSNPSTLYAGACGVVYRSTNGGTSWIATSAGLTGGCLEALGIDPMTPSTLVAVSFDGAFKSTNAGGSWSAVDVGLPAFVAPRTLAIDPSEPSTIYLGTEDGGVFESRSGGASWSPSNTGFANTDVQALAVDPSAPNRLYATTNGRGVSGVRLFASEHSGASWKERGAGLPDDWRFEALAIDLWTPSTLYAGMLGVGVFKSADRGSSWNAVNTGLGDFNVQDLEIDPANPSTLYAGTWGGVYKSVNGGTSWSAANAGLGELFIEDLAIDPSAPSTLYAGTFFGVDKSVDGGGSWSPMNAGFPADPDVRAVVIDPSTPSTLYAGTFGGVYKSLDGGGAWTATNTGLTDPDVRFLAIDPWNPSRLYAVVGFEGAVFETVDGGSSWSERTDLSGVQVVAVAIAPSALYVGTLGRGVLGLGDDAFETMGSLDSDDACYGVSQVLGRIDFHRQCDEDWAYFHGDAGATYRIETMDLRGDADTTVALHLNCGPELAFNDDHGASLASRIQWTATETGYHDIRVRGFADVYGGDRSYLLRVVRIDGLLFEDGFESGDASTWSVPIP